MNITTDDGLQLHVQVEGDGPALLFSNSLGTALAMWDAQLAALTGRYRIIRYDSRGHGRSGVPTAPYQIERLGRDALAVLDAVGVERASFCGLSMGGMVGQWLGANAPTRIQKLVIANTAAELGPPANWDARIDAVRAGGMIAITETVLERWFTAGFRTAQPDAVAKVRSMLHATDPTGYCGSCAAIRDMNQRALLPTITVPTLVIGGAFDPATPPAHAEELAQNIPGAQLVMLDAAHLSNIERTADFNAALTRFLEA
ncbi:3-oxoadipate enol-lactonase [Roseiterribacter gracilis]|uniref:3-oxoadipate enol-lactonase n=1 Tax=Roseiterribacter gracilis TaxID=2812848 RepID=A0A8S8XIX0_9PROT|nr:3-oxoadipate enol-lactonase [Rhodospirillales bacterium TMPK1]